MGEPVVGIDRQRAETFIPPALVHVRPVAAQERDAAGQVLEGGEVRGGGGAAGEDAVLEIGDQPRDDAPRHGLLERMDAFAVRGQAFAPELATAGGLDQRHRERKPVAEAARRSFDEIADAEPGPDFRRRRPRLRADLQRGMRGDHRDRAKPREAVRDFLGEAVKQGLIVRVLAGEGEDGHARRRIGAARGAAAAGSTASAASR